MQMCFHRKWLRPCWEHDFEGGSLDEALWYGFIPHLLYCGIIHLSFSSRSVLQIAGSRMTLAIDGEGKVSASFLQYLFALKMHLLLHDINVLRYCLGAGMPEALWDMGTGMLCSIPTLLFHLLCPGDCLDLQGEREKAPAHSCFERCQHSSGSLWWLALPGSIKYRPGICLGRQRIWTVRCGSRQKRCARTKSLPVTA